MAIAPENGTIALAWRKFQQESRLDALPEATRIAMRDVFYSAFSVAMGIVITAASKDVTDAEGAGILNDLILEIGAYSKQAAERTA